MRYLSNGALDNTFDGDGKKVITGLFGYSEDVAVQPDGKILFISTQKEPSGNTRFAIYRMTSTGALDASFDLDGLALIEFNPSTSVHEFGGALALRPDGRIVACGVSTEVLMVQLWPDGSIDLGGQQAQTSSIPLRHAY